MPPASRPLPPNLERIVQRFQQITEPKRRYEYLLWFAKRVPELSEAEQVAANKVPGCMSQVYITAEFRHDIRLPMPLHSIRGNDAPSSDLSSDP